uniref:helix-turn-helix domain-containing protein n=1 Tax=Candidatus Cryptobacteroides bacterium TaxID=3085639 RepID=UPI0040276FDD
MTNDLFHIRLREARLLCGLSMDKLAAKTNGAITKQSLSKYEAGGDVPQTWHTCRPGQSFGHR